MGAGLALGLSYFPSSLFPPRFPYNSPMGIAPSPRVAPAPHLRIHCVNVFVRDQDRSLRFYLDQLGFHLAFDARLQSGDRWVAVSPPDGSAILALIAPKPSAQEYKLI